MDKVLNFSLDGKYVRIGKDIPTSTWYLYDSKYNAKSNDSIVSFTHELRGSLKVLTSLEIHREVVNKDNTPEASEASEPTEQVPAKQIQPSALDLTGVSDASISKLAVALTLISMQGMIDPSNIESMIDSLSKKYNSI